MAPTEPDDDPSAGPRAAPTAPESTPIKTSPGTGHTPLATGSVLARSISIWLRNFATFSVLALIVFSPRIFATVIFMNSVPSDEETAQFEALMILPMLILSLVFNGALVFGVIEEIRGRHADFGRSVREGLSRMPTMISTGLSASILAGLATLAFIIPGLIVLCALYVAVPVAVVERPGVGAALRRSADLTRGHRWNIFGVLLLILTAHFAISMVTNRILDLSGAFSPTVGPSTARTLVLYVVDILLAPFGAVASTIVYHDLRVAKEGALVEDLASVFD